MSPSEPEKSSSKEEQAPDPLLGVAKEYCKFLVEQDELKKKIRSEPAFESSRWGTLFFILIVIFLFSILWFVFKIT